MGNPASNARGELERREAILSLLSQAYPEATIALTYRTPWELLVAVILSAQCTDVRVNMVTPKLFAKFPTIASFRDAPLEDIEQAIKSTGFFHAKARNIQKSAAIIMDRFSGEVPRTMKDMLTLSGVARKTANVVLGNAYGVVEGIAVDTHVIRLSQRLRLVNISTIGGKNKMFVKPYDLRPTTYDPTSTAKPASLGERGELSTKLLSSKPLIIDYLKDADPMKIEKELMDWIPRNEWVTVTYRLIDHGRAICKAQKPLCSDCPLASLCFVRRSL